MERRSSRNLEARQSGEISQATHDNNMLRRQSMELKQEIDTKVKRAIQENMDLYKSISKNLFDPLQRQYENEQQELMHRVESIQQQEDKSGERQNNYLQQVLLRYGNLYQNMLQIKDGIKQYEEQKDIIQDIIDKMPISKGIVARETHLELQKKHHLEIKERQNDIKERCTEIEKRRSQHDTDMHNLQTGYNSDMRNLRIDYNSNITSIEADYRVDMAQIEAKYNSDMREMHLPSTRRAIKAQYNTDMEEGRAQYNTDMEERQAQYNKDTGARQEQYNKDTGARQEQYNKDTLEMHNLNLKLQERHVQELKDMAVELGLAKSTQENPPPPPPPPPSSSSSSSYSDYVQ